MEIPIELARQLVRGAVDYAGALGFSPHPDFESARDHLGPLEGQPVIGFGRHGRPFFTAGPYDDVEQVLATLQASVGEGSYNFAVPVPM